MTWEDRLQEAAYTSPSGTRTAFKYEDVQFEIDNKTTGYNFPDSNGTFVQNLGNSGRRYPFRIFFSGRDYDLEISDFEQLLLETGIGKLEHPIYGTINVVPFGTITREDNLKTAANEGILRLTFWETIELIFPISQSDPSSSVLDSVNQYNSVTSQQFSDNINLESEIERANFKNTYLSLQGSTKSSLKDIANSQSDVKNEFDSIDSSINNSIDIFISDPVNLASQTTLFIQSPARSMMDISARLDAYSDLSQSIISGNSSIASKNNDSSNSNTFHTNDLYASTYVTGSIISVVNNEFFTKTEAIQAAESILNQFDNIKNWRDDNYTSLQEIDTGESYQALQESVSIAAGFLVEISFTLKQEKSIILNKDRTIIDLCSEFYGNVDEDLDFLISSNNISGSEILELKKGFNFVYYV